MIDETLICSDQVDKITELRLIIFGPRHLTATARYS